MVDNQWLMPLVSKEENGIHFIGNTGPYAAFVKVGFH